MSDKRVNGNTGAEAPPPPLAQAVALHLDGKRREALEVIDSALSSGTQSAELYSAKALIQYELGLFGDAADSYRRLLSLQPDHPSAALNLAICLERTGNWADASGAFATAVEKDPN